MTREEAIVDIRDNIKPVVGGISLNMAIEALEQQPCKDWHDVPSDEMTLEQARQAVKDLRKKLAEDLEKNRENLINQKATTCRHGGHCEWVACDKCNHYEPDALSQQPCEDAISRQAVLDGLASIAKVKARSDAQKSLMGRVIFFVEQLPPVTPKEKTAAWVPTDEEPHEIYECNACGWLLYDIDIVDFKYCPNCGARMVSHRKVRIRNDKQRAYRDLR